MKKLKQRKVTKFQSRYKVLEKMNAENSGRRHDRVNVFETR